jgi:4'-phosphopantetheinyl transferase
MPRFEEIEIYPVDVAENFSLVPRFEALLAPDEKERAADFRFDRDRIRFIVMRGMLRLVLSGCLDAAAASIDLEVDEYGKPSVPGELEFSVSYSGDMGLIVVAGTPVGVDIEKVDPGKVTAEMVEEVFSQGERESYFGGDEAEDMAAFFRGWVRKEAIAKAVGKGLSCPLAQVGSRLEQKSFTAVYEGSEWWTCELDRWRPEYEAALTAAWTGREPDVTLRSLELGIFEAGAWYGYNPIVEA